MTMPVGLTEADIGKWVTRERRGVWHVLQSVIDGGAVTKCGKRLRRPRTIDRGGLVTSDSPPIVASNGERRCFTCRIGIG